MIEIKRFFSHLHYLFIEQMGIKKSDGMIARQRLSVFTYASVGISISILVNLCGISGPQELFSTYVNVIHVAITLLLMLLVFYRKLTLIQGFSALALVTQAAISIEMCHVAYQNTPYHISLIIGNMVLLSFVLMISVIFYIRIIPIIIAVASIGTYAFCVVVTDNSDLANFFLLFAASFFIFALLSVHLIAQLKTLQGENTGLKKDHQEILELVEMTREQLLAYTTITKKKLKSPKETNDLMEIIGSKPREIICYNVNCLLEQERAKDANLEKMFPAFSRSEREICYLIIQDKKLNEICTTLNKSESNISCQRSNIRTKLGLGKNEDLRSKLLEVKIKEKKD